MADPLLMSEGNLMLNLICTSNLNTINVLELIKKFIIYFLWNRIRLHKSDLLRTTIQERDTI